MKWSAVVAVVLAALPGVGACTKNDPLYCAEGRPCRAADEDPTLNFCDVDGLYPASGGHGHTCIPSPFDAGVGVDAGVADASPAQDGGATATVTVSITGSGAGTVSSVPGGIDCGLVCASAFDVGSTVTLTAVPAAGSDFLGWSGPCAEPGPCIFTVGGDAAAEARFEPSGKSVWVARVGDVSDDIVKAAATLPDGDVVIGGSFGGMVMVGTQPLMSAGLSDAFIAKLARLDGAAQWAIRFGGTGADEVTGLATTADGDVVLAGTFSGAIDIGGMPVASNGAASDLVIARLRGTDGTTVWAKRVGGVGADLGGGVAVDKDGNVLVTARFTGTDILGVTTLNSAGGTDILVAKLAGADGAFLWAKAFGSMSNDAGIAIAADEDGNVLVTGSFQGTINLGGGPRTGGGGTDVFVAKLAGPNGAHVWSVAGGGTANDSGLGIATDVAGDVFVTGQFGDSLDFGAASVAASGLTDAFLAEFTSSGVAGWIRRYGGGGIDQGTAVAIEASGDLIVTGFFIGAIDLGGGGLSSVMSSVDAYVARLRSVDASHVWSRAMGGVSSDTALAVAVGTPMVIGGQFGGFVDFGGVSATSLGSQDAFCLGIAP